MVDHVTQVLPGELPTAFEDNLGWLLAQCFRAHVSAIEEAVADLPHAHRGYQALSGAAHCSARNQAELAKQLNVDRTVMVYLIDDLEEAGLVERVADPNDRRSRLIRATEEGLGRLRETERAISAAESALLSVLSADDQVRLRRMLRGIAAHHCAAAGPANPCDMAAQVVKTEAC
jgi:DNA-binding MarR family transcriptional regulator